MYWVIRKFCLKLFYESISEKKKTKYEASTASYPWLRSFLRSVHTRELAPETRSRNTLPGKYCTPTRTREGHHEGACSRSTLLQHARGAKLPRLHQRFLAKKYVAQQNFCSRVLHVISRPANFSAHEGTCS